MTGAATGSREQLRLAVWLLAAGLCVTPMSHLLDTLLEWVEAYFQELLHRRVQTALVTKAARLPLFFYERPETYDRLRRVRDQTGGRMLQVSGLVARAAGSPVTVGSFMILPGSAHQLLPLGLVPMLLLALAANLRWGLERFALARANTEPQCAMGYLENLFTGPAAAKEILLFRIGDYLRPRW